MKRSRLASLSAFFLLSCVGLTATAQVPVYIENVSANGETRVVVPVIVDADVTDEGISAVDVRIQYNTPDDIITSAAASAGTLISEGSGCNNLLYNIIGDELIVSIACGVDTLVGGPGVLFNIELTLDPSLGDLSLLTFTKFDFDEDTIPSTTTDGSVVISGPPLPVELTSFDALVNGSDVSLSWSTASETNNAGFEVQQWTGDGFEAIAFVEGQGTTTAAQAYRYRVAEVTPGTHRFRLKQIDFDGAFEYSPEVTTTVGFEGSFHLSPPYPNPFNPSTSLSLTVAQTQPVRVEVFDVVGRRVAMLHDGVMEQNRPYRLHFDAAALPSGTYVYRAQGATFTASRLLTLTK